VSFGHSLFMAWLGVMGALWVLVLALAAIGWALPRPFKDSVFREPHFRPAELGFLCGAPMGFIRTLMLMRLVASPASGRKRGLVDVHLRAPPWFLPLARVGIPLFFTLLAAFFGLLAWMLLVPPSAG
jgi:hypothetical protein